MYIDSSGRLSDSRLNLDLTWFTLFCFQLRVFIKVGATLLTLHAAHPHRTTHISRTQANPRGGLLPLIPGGWLERSSRQEVPVYHQQARRRVSPSIPCGAPAKWQPQDGTGSSLCPMGVSSSLRGFSSSTPSPCGAPAKWQPQVCTPLISPPDGGLLLLFTQRLSFL
jgi:hypothetical protein